MRKKASASTAPCPVRALATAVASFDTRALWQAREEGPAAWEEEARLCKELAADLAGVAREAWEAAGPPDPLAAGCAVGTLHGFGHIAEGIDCRLARAGPAWLEPELFAHSPAHVVAALACIQLGLAGGTITFLGPGSGERAGRHAVRALRLGKQRTYLVGTYEAVAPAAACRLAELGVSADPGRAQAAFAVLAPERPESESSR
jgi:3-oxoacyl-(acyl-carrier-protein) synthase